MKSRLFIAICGLTLEIIGYTQQANACSMSQDFVRPTNFELIQMTDAIVVATAVKQTKSDGDNTQVHFRVDKVLKGNPPSQLVDSSAVLGTPPPSDPDDLTSAHPFAYRGPCNRMTFRKGGQYVLFVFHVKSGKYKGRWFPGGPAFSRINEDYFGEDSLWVRTIRYYLSIQEKHEPMEQLEILKTKHTELLAKGESMSADERKLATDIADHLSSRSPYKPTEYLLQTYEALDKGRELPFTVRGPEADKEKSQARAIADLVTGKKPDPEFDVEAQKQFVLWALVNGDHPKAMPLFERLSRSVNLKPAIAGVVTKFFAKHGRYRDAINLVNTHAFRIVNNAPLSEVNQFLRGVMAMHYHEENGMIDYAREKWKEDEYAKEWWPEFALAINRAMRNRFGQGRTYLFHEEIALLKSDNYRDRPVVTLELARSYDEDVVDWAWRELNRLLSSNVESYKDEYQLPVDVLLAGYRPKHEKRMEELVCKSEDARRVVIRYLGNHKHIYTEGLSEQLAALELDNEDRETLIKSLTMFAADSQRKYLSGMGILFAFDDDAYDLIVALARKEPVKLTSDKIKPFDCK